MKDKSKPWIAKYWRDYRTFRKWGYPPSQARKLAGKTASHWWFMMKLTGPGDAHG